MSKCEIRFSVIVPVYNVKKYLPQCLESVLTQSFKGLEVILVDDGSSDGSGKLCDEYARKDARIKVVHKENGGLSSARNVGLNVASGEYVVFLDSDDFWDDTHALEYINGQLVETNAELLIFPAKRYYEIDNSYTYILNCEVDRNRVIDADVKNVIRYLLKNNIYRAAAWNKVIYRQLIENYGMRFKEGYLSEDMDWCGDLLLYVKRFDFYNQPFYCYRQQRANSITKRKSDKLIADKLYMCEKGLKQAKALSDTEMSELLASYYAYEYSVTLGVSSGIRNQQILKKMKELRNLLDYDLCDKVKAVHTLKKTLGYGTARKILCLFVKIKR